jgi:Skp family chaperone for outer membrane proteins
MAGDCRGFCEKTMKNQVLLAVSGVCVLLTSGAIEATGSASVAVVSIADVSEKYQRTGDLEGFFEAQRSQFHRVRDEQRQKIERMTKSLQEELRPGTAEFRERAKQIAMLDAELKWFMESEGQRLEEGLKASLRSIYDDIVVVVREVAEEKQVDVVVAADRLPDALPESPNQLRQQILLQKVLYWSPKVDLTPEVIQRLNARYQASGNKPGEAAAGGAGGTGAQPATPPKAANKP